MKLGVDVGNYTTKTSKGVIFDSRIALGHKQLNDDDIKVEYEGKALTVGAGRREISTDRIFSDLYDICLLTAIAKSFPDKQNVTVELVVGLPPIPFEGELREELQAKLDDFGTKNITIDDKKIVITVNKAAVYSESAIVFAKPSEYRKRKTLVIDIGGGTCDISEFNKALKLVNSTTTGFGMLSLYENMKKEFNKRERANYSVEMMEGLLGKNTEEVKGTKRNISYLQDTINEFVIEICNICNQNFDTESTRIVLIGGGASALINYFKKHYDNAELAQDNQFTNANTYEVVANMLWGE